MKHLNLIFVLILQLNLVRQQLRAVEMKPFHCNTTEKANELLNEKAKRVTTNQGWVYMIYQHKIISFRIPIFFLNRDSRLYHLSSPIFELETEDIDTSNSNNSSDSNNSTHHALRPVGSMVVYGRSETFDILLNETGDLVVRELDFKNGALGNKTEEELSELPIYDNGRFLNTAQSSFERLKFLFIFLDNTTVGGDMFFEYEGSTLYSGYMKGTYPQGQFSTVPFDLDYGKRKAISKDAIWFIRLFQISS